MNYKGIIKALVYTLSGGVLVAHAAIPLTGLYAGAGISRNSLAIEQGLNFDPDEVESIPLDDKVSLTGRSNNGQAYVGYGFTYNRFYVGGELTADFDRQSHEFSNEDDITRFAKSNTYGASLRLGYLVTPQVLLYGIAGVTRTDISGQILFINGDIYDKDFIHLKNTDELSNNGVIGKEWGLGASTTITENLSLRAEYRRIHYSKTVNFDLNDKVFDIYNPIGQGALSFKDQDVISLGLSYQFSSL